MIHINGTKQAKSTQQPKSGCYSCLWGSFLPSCSERRDSDWCLSSLWYCQDVVRQNKDTPKSCNMSKDEEAVPEDGVRRWRGGCEKLLQPRWFTSPVQDHRQQPSHWCFSISIVCSGFSCWVFFFMIFFYWPDVLQNTDEEGGVCHQVTIAGSPSKLLQHYFTSPVIKAQRQKVRVRNGVRLSDGRLSRFDDIHWGLVFWKLGGKRQMKKGRIRSNTWGKKPSEISAVCWRILFL